MNKLLKILDKKRIEKFIIYMIRKFFININWVENILPYSSLNSFIQTNNKITNVRNNHIILQLYKIFNLGDIIWIIIIF